MLFNSNAFVFVYLPLVLAGFFALQRLWGSRSALGFLLLASLFFYGWWNPAYVGLILVSIGANFGLARAAPRIEHPAARRAALTLGIAFDLGLLGYFKYANFFVANFESLVGTDIGWTHVTLPIAISFFTFQQIAYLVDTFRGTEQQGSLLDYALFVTFFPQLIAGPIVHHREMLPQFRDEAGLRFSRSNLSVGLTIFVAGLFKKTVIADTMATFSTPIFALAEGDAPIAFLDAWGAALSYTFQIYFDFSGYSDMAIGLGRMFGLRLPINFESPYRAASIIDFWRRWHITLSRFLRDYLYIPLGGSRRGTTRRYTNLWITMILGGLWHGAGWNFLLWGGLHGSYLVVNHLWRAGFRALGWHRAPSRRWRGIGVALTFAVTVIAWVPFRADSWHGTERMFASMFSWEAATTVELDTLQLAPLVPLAPHGSADASHWLVLQGRPHGPGAHLRVPLSDREHFDARYWVLEPFDFEIGGAWWLLLCMTMVWALPNTREWMADYEPGLETYPQPESRWSRESRLGRWRPSVAWAAFTALLAFGSILAIQGRLSEFIYFQF